MLCSSEENEKLLRQDSLTYAFVTTNNNFNENSSLNHPQTLTPPPPRYVSRSCTSITLRLPTYRQLPKGKRRFPKIVDHFKVYGKVTGAGTAVSLNNNEYEGLGIPLLAMQVPTSTNSSDNNNNDIITRIYTVDNKGGRDTNPTVTIHGLVPNESYVFAVAAFDANNSVIEGIGATSEVPIVTSLPLPTLLIWSYLGNIAVNKGLNSISKKACDYVYASFVNVQPFGVGVS